MAKDGDRSASPLRGMDVEAHLRDPARKQAFVTPMFDTIAPRYDDFTRLFSFGMDAGWKQEAMGALVARLSPHAAGGASLQLLDLACGTGDLAVAAAAALPRAQVLALDASPRMIDMAAARLRTEPADIRVRVRPLVGDMDALALPDASIDAISAGYGVRNVPDAARAVREMARVLRPGGVLLTLDFYRPQFAPWRAALLAYLQGAGNVVGWWWHRDPVVYGYIARSIAHFISWQEFSALLTRSGFRVEQVTRHLGGGIATHVAVRE